MCVGKQAVVQAHFGLHAIGHGHPGDSSYGYVAVSAGGPLMLPMGMRACFFKIKVPKSVG